MSEYAIRTHISSVHHSIADADNGNPRSTLIVLRRIPSMVISIFLRCSMKLCGAVGEYLPVGSVSRTRIKHCLIFIVLPYIASMTVDRSWQVSVYSTAIISPLSSRLKSSRKYSGSLSKWSDRASGEILSQIWSVLVCEVFLRGGLFCCCRF